VLKLCLTYVSPDLELDVTNEMTKNLMCHGNVNLNDKNTKKCHDNIGSPQKYNVK
jgi:hypothetical protein